MGKKNKAPKKPTVGVPRNKILKQHYAYRAPPIISVTKGPIKLKLLKEARREMGCAPHPALIIPPMKRNTKSQL